MNEWTSNIDGLQFTEISNNKKNRRYDDILTQLTGNLI